MSQPSDRKDDSELAVSVVIPAYDAAEFIDGALASIAEQTRPADEVIVVDDGSSDSTATQAEAWGDRLPIRVIRLERNAGAGVARKVAIEAASHPYIANLDADDRWDRDHLQTMLGLAGPDIIVGAKCRRRRSDGTGGVSERPTAIPPPERQVEEILRANFLFSGSLYPKRALCDPDVGHSELRGAQDWETWIRLIVIAGHRAVLSTHATVTKVSRPEAVSVARSYLQADLRVYESLAADDRFAPWHHLLPAHVERRRARQFMLEAVDATRAGRTGEARRLFLRACRTDPSLRGGRGRAASGSVALRSLVGVISPTLFMRWRERRAAADGVITGGG